MLALIAGLLIAAAPSPPAPEVPEDAISLRRDLFVQPLLPGVWRHVSFRDDPSAGAVPSNGLVVRVDASRALVVDTAWNPEQTASLLDWIEQAIGSISALVITHAHEDRLGGIEEVHRRGIPSVALRATADLAKAAGWSEVTRPVDSGFRLEALGISGEIFFPGPGHTADNSVVYFDDSRLLAGTCMVRAAGATTLGNTQDGDIGAWSGSIVELERRYPAIEVVVPGHGPPGGPELLSHTLDLLAGRPPAER